jgi:hypothetical protein
MDKLLGTLKLGKPVVNGGIFRTNIRGIVLKVCALNFLTMEPHGKL